MTLDFDGKPVYIVTDHAEVLIAWADLRRDGIKRHVITLDHHTDTRPPFVTHLCKLNVDRTVLFSESRKLVSEIDYNDEASVASAISKLNNDEHITTAIEADIVSFAFIVTDDHGTATVPIEILQYQTDFPPIMRALMPSLDYPPMPVPPYTFAQPPNGTFVVEFDCVEGCVNDNHEDDDCLRLYADQAIESTHLVRCMERIKAMGHAVGIGDLFENGSYILDIDLDYFRTRKAISPANTEAFQA